MTSGADDDVMSHRVSSATGIHLWVLGQADVSWAEKAGGKRSHFEYEIYMKDCIILWGRGMCSVCVGPM